MKGNIKIAPSILAADFANLQKEIEAINKTDAEILHIDIMDGVFVPNISFGFPVTNAIHKHTQKPLDFHLMIQDPDPYLEICKESGAESLSVHYETCPHLHRTVTRIKELGMKAGVALNPHTPVELLEDIIGEIDIILLMSVNPGFGGQKFIERTFDKITQCKELIAGVGHHVDIEIDGGVTVANSHALAKAGATILVAGNTVFRSNDYAQVISDLR